MFLPTHTSFSKFKKRFHSHTAARLAFASLLKGLDYFLARMYHMCVVLPDSHENISSFSKEEKRLCLKLVGSAKY